MRIDMRNNLLLTMAARSNNFGDMEEGQSFSIQETDEASAAYMDEDAAVDLVRGRDQNQVKDKKPSGSSYRTMNLPIPAMEGYGRAVRFPDYVLEESRELSMVGFPGNENIRKKLITAGFFYSGNKDLVQCYKCGNGLINFEPEDDVDELVDDHRRVCM